MEYDHEARISYDTDITVQNAEGTVTATFTQPVLSYETSFDYRTADGSAQAGINYTASSGTVTFAPGETSKTVEIAVLQEDRRWDGNQSFYIELENADNVLFSNGESAASITVNISQEYDFSAYQRSPQRGTMRVTVGTSFGSSERNYDYGTSTDYIGLTSSRIDVDFDRTLTEADLEALKDGRITAMQLSTQIYEKSFGPNLGDIIYTPAECDMRSLIYLSENSLSSAFLSFSENNGITIDNDKHTIQITDEIREKLLELNQFHVGWQFSCSSDDNDFYAMLSDGLAFVDNKAPTLQSVSVPEGTYYIGQVVPITVTFSEPVRSADARITMNGMELTPESSSDGSDRLVFPYTVTTENATAFAGIKVTGVSGITDFGNNNMIDDTQTRSFEQAKISVLREKAFTSLSIDKESYSADGENALVEIGLNKDLSKWVEQDGGLDQIRISADGGATMIPVDWKRIEGVASDDTLVAEVKLPGNSSSSSNSVRIEIYLRDEENQEKYAIVLGKYCDAVIRPTVYPESIMIDESTYPDENIIYFVSPPTFTFTTDPAFSALEPEPQVTWTSSNPEVAASTIRER